MLREQYKELPLSQRLKLERSNRLLDAGRIGSFDAFIGKCTAEERDELANNIRRYYFEDPRRPTTRFFRLPDAEPAGYRNAS